MSDNNVIPFTQPGGQLCENRNYYYKEWEEVEEEVDPATNVRKTTKKKAREVSTIRVQKDSSCNIL